MGYLRIHCSNCRRRWAVYDRDDWKSEASRTCPHCGVKINAQTWENQVLPAFGAMRDANMMLHKDHTGYKNPLFRVDFVSNNTTERN